MVDVSQHNKKAGHTYGRKTAEVRIFNQVLAPALRGYLAHLALLSLIDMVRLT